MATTAPRSLAQSASKSPHIGSQDDPWRRGRDFVDGGLAGIGEFASVAASGGGGGARRGRRGRRGERDAEG